MKWTAAQSPTEEEQEEEEEEEESYCSSTDKQLKARFSLPQLFFI